MTKHIQQKLTKRTKANGRPKGLCFLCCLLFSVSALATDCRPWDDVPGDARLTNHVPLEVACTGGSVYINFITPTNRTFQIQCTDGLPAPWIAFTAPLVLPVHGTNRTERGMITINPCEQMLFFRVMMN